MSGMISPAQTWLYACGAVVVISVVGLVSILFIPLIQRDRHSDLLQLLVGLAIGTLTSDALLHLLPHAFSSFDKDDHKTGVESDDHNHNNLVWFGLMTLLGIIGFLTFERIVTIVTDLCNKSHKKTKIANCNRSSGEKHSNHNLNSDQTSHTELEKMNNETKFEDTKIANEPSNDDCLSNINGNINQSSSHDMQLTTEQCHRETIVYPHPDPDRGFVVQLTDHHHHHQTQTQRGAKSVIYMIITGDGLHNFCDGIAIGVAFAGGFSGGISTTIAVLCHELPHEVGDFAVLLRAGLSVKRAIIYNALSGLLCFVGMSIGVAVGKVNDAWLSATIAGMFLYIALVDMIPQLDCCPSQPGTTRAYKLTVQLIGISIGVAIMCIISIYESHIKLLFD